jgi:dienelactone hydrolase
MLTKNIEYCDGDVVLEGYLAYDDKLSGKLPAVLVSHDWTGRNEFACKKAEKLAELGYVGFALDMYGKGVLGNSNDEKARLMQPFMENRNSLQKRLFAALDTVKKLEMVDATRIAAIGFCFGGLCVLDLARSGADVRGVVSFHGFLSTPANTQQAAIKAKILALHGHNDPMVPPDHVLAFEQEMTAAHADWQVHVYGNTVHAFTNPQANDPGFGTVYKELAAKRSWVAMQNFFAEVLA